MGSVCSLLKLTVLMTRCAIACRQLYLLLHEAAQIVGLWRVIGEGPQSSLVSFQWTEDGIDGTQLVPQTPLGYVEAAVWACLSPARGLCAAIAVEADGRHATVRLEGSCRHDVPKSSSAEAAAMVALPHAQVKIKHLAQPLAQCCSAQLTDA
jgi:hypothetical protein